MRIKLRLFGISVVAQAEIGALIVSPPERPWSMFSIDASVPRIVNAIHTDWITIDPAGHSHFANLDGYRGQVVIDGWVIGTGEARVEVTLFDGSGAEAYKISRNTTCYGVSAGNLQISADFVRGRSPEEIRRRAFRDQFRHDPTYPR